MVYLYENGLPWMTGEHPLYKKDKLAWNLDQLMERVNNGKASVILVDGIIGEGKTTMAVHIADYFLNKGDFTSGVFIDFDEQLAMGVKDFSIKLITVKEKKMTHLVFDEAGAYNSKRTMTGANNQIDEIFRQFRAFRILLIMTMPSFLELPAHMFRNSIPRLLIHCHGRTGESGNISCYDITSMNYMRLFAEKNRATPNECYKRIVPNFRGKFHNLDPVRSRELDTHGIKGKTKMATETAIHLNGLMNSQDIADKTGMSLIWVRKKLLEMKAQPKMVHLRVKYFPKEIVERLKNMAKKK